MMRFLNDNLWRFRPTVRWDAALAAVLAVSCLAGCGTTQSRSATEQLLTSDAVDRSIARIDFRSLSGQKVFLDVEYLKNVKGIGTVNSEYVISSLRQQLLAAGCLLQESKPLADFVVEARVGALGLDGHEVIYGIPANNGLNLASNLVPAAPTLPTIPELALAKKNDQMAAAKIGVFAYHRVTREVVWQSGISESLSASRDNWVMGAGPFQTGTIYKEPRFAGGIGLLTSSSPARELPSDVKYTEARVFKSPSQIKVPPPTVIGATSPPAPVSLVASPAVAAQSISKKPNEPAAMAEVPEEELDLMAPDVAARLAIPGQKLQHALPAPPRRGSRQVTPRELESELIRDARIIPVGGTDNPFDFAAPADASTGGFRTAAPTALDSSLPAGKN